MPVKLFQTILTVYILLGSTSTWASPNSTPPSPAEKAEIERLRWNNVYKAQFTPLQIEILSFCAVGHAARERIVAAAAQTAIYRWTRPQIIHYLEMHSYDLQDQIVDEIITTFDSKDKDRIKSFITHLELGEANQFFDETLLKLTPKGLETFDPKLNLFSSAGLERRAYAKMQQEEYMRRHESLLIIKEKELQEKLAAKEREFQEKERYLQAFLTKLNAKKEKLRQVKARNAAKIEAAKKYESELQVQAKEIQKAHERRLEKEEELLKQHATILKEGSAIQKIQAELMRKEHDLAIKEKAINLASTKLMEKITSQKAAAERDPLNDFFIVDDYHSGENVLPTRDTTKGGKSNSKRFRPSIDQLEADAKLLGSMRRTHSRDLRDLPEDSNERVIQ